MNCPNNCSGLAKMIYIDIAPKIYAKILSTNIRGRKGVSSIELLETEPDIIFEIEVDQSAYDTENYFYYRNSYESEDAFGVLDKEHNAVHLIYAGRPITRGNKCVECGEVYHPEIDQNNISEIESENAVFDWSLPI